MNIWTHYRQRISQWIDKLRWIKAGVVMVMCIVVEILFICLPLVLKENGVTFALPVWPLAIAFPLALAVDVTLSMKGYDTFDDDWHRMMLFPFYLFLLLGLVFMAVYVVVLFGALFTGREVSFGPLDDMDPELLMWLMIAAMTALFIVIPLIRIFLRYRRESRSILLLQLARAVLSPLVGIPYFMLHLMSTDTRPDNEETRRAIAREREEEFREAVAAARRESDEPEGDADGEPGLLDWLDERANGRETGNTVFHGGETHQVRRDRDGDCFINTDDGRKRYNPLTGDVEDN